MPDILDETLEDLREEKINRIFFIGAKIFIVVLVIFLVSSISYYAWNKFQENKIYALGSEYLVGMLKMQSQDYQKGIDIMEKLASNNVSYSALAGLNYASFLSAKQEFSKAGKVYGMISNNKDFAQVFRDFASLMQISMRINSDEIDAKQAVEALNKYIEANPIFQNLAKEQLAAIFLSLNDKMKAQSLLIEIIASHDTSEALKLQAKEMLVLTNNN